MAGRGDQGGGVVARPGPVGRPPRISRDTIAAAAHDIGLENLTLRSVADRLGVSIAALYHHVGNKDDLLRAAAEHALARRRPPADEGQHWARWLAEWAFYVEGSFTADPGLLAQYLDGDIGADAVADNQDRAIDLLLREGFTAREAIGAFQLVTTMAVGWAVHEIREHRGHDAAGCAGVGVGEEAGALSAGLQAVLDRRAPDELPNLRRLVADGGRPLLPTFAEQITGALAGLALRRGEEVDEVLRLLAPA